MSKFITIRHGKEIEAHINIEEIVSVSTYNHKTIIRLKNKEVVWPEETVQEVMNKINQGEN